MLTDSGGIQEEAPSFGVPVLVMRDVTERPEAIAAGWAELVGTDPATIRAAARRLLATRPRPAAVNPFGDGHSAPRVVAAVRELLLTQQRTEEPLAEFERVALLEDRTGEARVGGQEGPGGRG